MSLKTTPKGLLAALAALSIVLLQLPAMVGQRAVAASPASLPARAVVASHAALRPHTQTIGPSASVTFASSTAPITGSTAAISPTAGPAGVPVTVTGTISPSNVTTATAPSQLITVSVTDSKGISAVLGTATAVSPTFGFTLNNTLPTTLTTGSVTVTAVTTNTTVTVGSNPPTSTITSTVLVTATLPFTINAPTLTLGPPSSPEFISGNAPPDAVHATTATITGTNFAPGVLISPTIAFSNGAGVTSTAVLTSLTPISNGTTSEGNFTAVVSISTGIPYSTTSTISVAATYPVTPAYPSVFVEQRPVLTPSVISSTVGPGFVTGLANTVSITSSAYVTGTSGTFLGNSPITFTMGLSGTAGSVVVPAAPVTTNASGVFAAAIPFTPTASGTYVITASDLGAANVATTTISVVSPTAPAGTTYFAEGYTGGASAGISGTTPAGFKTVFNILNPNASTVLVTSTYILEAPAITDTGVVTPTTAVPDVVVVTRTVPALADITVDAAADIASQPVASGPDAGKLVSGIGQKVATIVQTGGFPGLGPLASGGVVRGVAVERIIERTAPSGVRKDGDVSLGTTSPNTSYYFSEGYTGSSFQEYLVLLNPSRTVTATVSVLRVPEGAASALPALGPIILDPLQRVTINVTRLNATAAEQKIGLIVNSADNPIVAERVLYFGPGNGSTKPGETIAAGMTTAAKQLNFAYGSLTGDFTVANPVTGTVIPNSDIAQTIDDRPFISVINPNIAGQVIAGTVSGSATTPGPSAHVTVQLRGENGRLLGFFITDVDAGARFTLTYNDLTSGSSGIGFPGVPQAAPTRAGAFSAVVSSSERVVAEEAQYYGQGSVTPSGDANSGAPGVDLVGAPSGETDVVFPALNTTDPNSTLPLSNTVFLYNPGVDPIVVSGTYYGATGVITHSNYTIGPDAIQVIGTASAFSGGTAAGAPIPAGTTGAEFTIVQQRGPTSSGEPAQAAESFVAAAVTHSADATNWWGSQGLYPLPIASSCSPTTGCP